MSDTIRDPLDFRCLYEVASGQHGYFTTAQARACGFRSNLISYHVKTGKFGRIHRGVYRIRDFPFSPRENVMVAWLGVGTERSIVSHESALDLLDLGDVIADGVHLTVPRSIRNLPHLNGVVIHTTTRPIAEDDIVVRNGIRLTSAVRSILDSAEAGTAPEQIEAAIRDALHQGLATHGQLERGSHLRSRRVEELVAYGLKAAA